MSEICSHWWLITRESQRKGGWRLRVRCSWCGKQQIWQPYQGKHARNIAWWRQTHPDSRA